MTAWLPCPAAGRFSFTSGTLKRQWEVLHAGDREPWPEDAALARAWCRFHQGEYQAAWQAAQELGYPGITLACKAAAMYATHLETDEQRRQTLYAEVAQGAQALAERSPGNAAAWYWQAYALGRYSQGISVAKALAQGLGTRVRQALERTIALQPLHADAYVALGAFHAEVIDKVGVLIGSMTYGARKDTGLGHYQRALELNPVSPMAMVEYGNALVMMEGERALEQTLQWLDRARACEPADATQWLEVRLAGQEAQSLRQNLST